MTPEAVAPKSLMSQEEAFEILDSQTTSISGLFPKYEHLVYGADPQEISRRITQVVITKADTDIHKRVIPGAKVEQVVAINIERDRAKVIAAALVLQGFKLESDKFIMSKGDQGEFTMLRLIREQALLVDGNSLRENDGRLQFNAFNTPPA